MRDGRDLERKLASIDGRGYKAYKSLAGTYDLGAFILHLDHIQGDPFAAPSRGRIEVAAREARFPLWAYENRERRVAFQDFLTREMDRALSELPPLAEGSGKSGLMAVDRPGQEIMERTSMVVDEGRIEARFVVGLPARGRRVMGDAARRMLLSLLPPAVSRALNHARIDESALRQHIQTAEDQHYLRQRLGEAGLVGFLGQGSILPRQSGISDLPLTGSQALPLEVPDDLAVTLRVPHWGEVRGLGIPRGITLIVGGGYHGKSTLLRALERGIYTHVPGDGRELVVTDPTAVKVRAEDGRRVEGVDITPFINNLPGGSGTDFFRSDSASGSTSQAAGIMEALELGSRCLLLDEDTSASNFMIRDARMQALVHRDKEPITPFVDRVRGLYCDLGVSTILVMGGSGDYFDVAHTVIMMDSYRPRHVSALARRVARDLPALRKKEVPAPLSQPRERYPDQSSLSARRGGRDRVRARGIREIKFGVHDIDLSQVEQIVHPSQTRAIGDVIGRLVAPYLRDGLSLRRALEMCLADLCREGLDILSPYGGHPGDYAEVRLFEIGAAMNRLRGMRVQAGKWGESGGN